MKSRVPTWIILLFVFGFGAGIFLADRAQAVYYCPFCACQSYCSTDTGRYCTDPARPYYEYSYHCIRPPGMYCSCALLEGAFAGCCPQ